MDVVVDVFYLIYSSNIYSSCYVHTLSWNSTRSGAAAFIGIFGVVLIFGA